MPMRRDAERECVAFVDKRVELCRSAEGRERACGIFPPTLQFLYGFLREFAGLDSRGIVRNFRQSGVKKQTGKIPICIEIAFAAVELPACRYKRLVRLLYLWETRDDPV